MLFGKFWIARAAILILVQSTMGFGRAVVNFHNFRQVKALLSAAESLRTANESVASCVFWC